MPKAYSRLTCGSASQLWRETGASRREAAERFEVSVASGGKVAAALVSSRGAPLPKPRGGSVSPLEEFSRSRFWI